MRLPSTIGSFLFITSLYLSICLGTTEVHATSDHPFYWEKIDVDLQLVESGDLLVTETQKYVFTDRYKNQRNRYIQIDKIDEIKDVIVTENNQPVSNLQLYKLNGQQHISWKHTFTDKFPDSHIFVLKYRVIGGLEVENSQTKFKWMAIFPDRHAPIKSAQVTLHLPAKLSAATKNFTTSGVAVDTKSVDPTTIQFIAKGSIEPQSKLAILGHFPTNSLQLNKSQWQSSSSGNWWGLLWIPFLCAPLFVILSLFSAENSSAGGSRSSRSRSRGGDGGYDGYDGGDGGDGGGGCGGCGGGD
ncbi:DUF2207 domain-containing protein [Chamaesiphon sp. VAR_48_metabat_135_sub]|uniref:DUF2207 domain-containing protein n=1 Tax=Chamaesiphon sp. VAR_48_metabat_135_sub TaxID=2964699 RepID=UPI00286BA6DE|nr:DUF2207 domain-containing protein [Chamaesiphon sp. VAR_48_metabat_135_sub]